MGLAPTGKRRLTTAHTRGETFGVTLAAADGNRRFRVEGHRAASGNADYIWIGDISDIARRAAAAVERATHDAAHLDQLTAAFDALPFPAWRRDGDRRLVHVNQAYARALDTDQATVTAEGRELFAADGDDDPAPTADAPDGGRTARHHVVIDGVRRLMVATELPTAEAGWVGCAIDASDAERAERELKRHIAAHADILENLGVAISIYGPDTRLKFYNSAFAKLWHMDPTWLARQPTLSEELELLREKRLLPEDVDFHTYKAKQIALFTSMLEPVEELMHLPNEMALRRRIAPHPFGGLQFAYEDVTDRLTLERNYNTAIAVQRRTLDNLYEGVALIGADGRLKLSNPAYARLWHFDGDELEGEPHVADLVEHSRELYPSDDNWSRMKDRIIARMTSREGAGGRIERTDGTVVEYVNVPLPDGAVLLSYIDITDRSQVEQALRERADALEAVDRLQTEFIANVSYELRTPLTSITGFAEMLHTETFGKLNQRQIGYVDGILQASRDLLALINEILDLATIEAGHMELQPTRFDIHALMVSVFSLTSERARQKHLEMHFECAADIGAMTADERRLKLVLFNLVSNAINFTQGAGTVTLGAQRDGRQVVFTVSDTGIGIPDSEQELVMDRFYRGKQESGRRSGAGAGLGLSLVRSFVELHGGTVELTSTPGQGTSVICRVPADPVMAVKPVAGAA